MPAPDAMALLAAWSSAERSPAHLRLGRLLATVVPEEALAADRLGDRHRRLLELHRALSDRPIEGRVHCDRCHGETEFTLPAAAMLANPAGDPAALVTLETAAGPHRFRQPRLADILDAGPPFERTVLHRCAIDGPASDDPALAVAAAAAFEALDPLANLVVETPCADCGAPIAASVELASFVVAAVDRIHDFLLRDIDMIAGAYGWSETAICALPPPRRAHYVAMIAARRAAVTPASARRWA